MPQRKRSERVRTQISALEDLLERNGFVLLSVRPKSQSFSSVNFARSTLRFSVRTPSQQNFFTFEITFFGRLSRSRRCSYFQITLIDINNLIISNYNYFFCDVFLSLNRNVTLFLRHKLGVHMLFYFSLLLHFKMLSIALQNAITIFFSNLNAFTVPSFTVCPEISLQQIISPTKVNFAHCQVCDWTNAGTRDDSESL